MVSTLPLSTLNSWRRIRQGFGFHKVKSIDRKVWEDLLWYRFEILFCLFDCLFLSILIYNGGKFFFGGPPPRGYFRWHLKFPFLRQQNILIPEKKKRILWNSFITNYLRRTRELRFELSLDFLFIVSKKYPGSSLHRNILQNYKNKGTKRTKIQIN